MEQSKINSFELTRDFIIDAQSWKKWKRSLELYLVAKGISNHKHKFATLLHLGGDDLQEIYDSLPQSANGGVEA